MALAYKVDDLWTQITGDIEIDGEAYTFEDILLADTEGRAELGIYDIQEREEGPLGPRISCRLENEKDPETDEDRPVWIYTRVAEQTPEDRAAIEALAAKKRDIEARIQQAFNKGYLVVHAAFVSERLQCRDDSDRTNWLVAEKEYVKAVAAGAGDVKGAEFRVASNKTIKVSFTDAIAILGGLTAWGFAIMKRGWALKDAMAAGEEYDLEAGWPL